MINRPGMDFRRENCPEFTAAIKILLELLKNLHIPTSEFRDDSAH
jgi:hypothetical protein